ncbi:hypothetical protein D3C80_1714880 [compost metagenome]
MGVGGVARHGQDLGPGVPQPHGHRAQGPPRRLWLAMPVRDLRVHIHDHPHMVLVPLGRGQGLYPRQKGHRRRRPHAAQNA